MAKRSKKPAKKKAARKKAPVKKPSASIRTASVRPVKTASQIMKEYKPHFAHHAHYAAAEGFKKRRGRHIVGGLWALILAVLASVVLALIETPYFVLVLVAVGFIVGFLNFEHEETVKFLVATATMLIVASAVLLSGFSRLEIVMPVVALYLRKASYNVIAVVAPAAFVLSIKALKELAE